MATALHKCLSFSVEKVVNYNRSMKFGRSEINAYTYTNFVKVFSCAEIYRHAYRVKYEAYTSIWLQVHEDGSTDHRPRDDSLVGCTAVCGAVRCGDCWL